MRKKLKALVGMMSLCALGAVGSAFALTREGVNAPGTAGHFEQAVYLYWGDAKTSITLDDCDDLTANVPVYRYLAVAPQSTKTVAGTVTVDFELEKSTGDYHIEGVTVTVYRADVAINDDNVATYAIDANKVAELPGEDGSDSFAITASTEKQTTTKYYAIKVVWDGKNDTSHPAYVLGGSVNISQSFAA